MRKQFEFEDKVGNNCIVQMPEIMIEPIVRIGAITLVDGSYNSPMVLNVSDAKKVIAFLLYFVTFNDISVNDEAYAEIIKLINSLETFSKFIIKSNNIELEMDE